MSWILKEDRLVFEAEAGVSVMTTARSLSLPAGEPEVSALRSRVEAAGFRPGSVIGMRQVHEARIEKVGQGPDRLVSSCDGLVTAQPGVALVVRTADCLPIVAFGKEGQTGVVHAGWRGIRAGIPGRLIERLGGPGAVTGAAIGAGIGPCCYEVGAEFEPWFGPQLQRRQGKLYLDLAAAAAKQMERAGLPAGRIERAPWCTACLAAPELHSYRRDGPAAGRMLTVAMLL